MALAVINDIGPLISHASSLSNFFNDALRCLQLISQGCQEYRIVGGNLFVRSTVVPVQSSAMFTQLTYGGGQGNEHCRGIGGGTILRRVIYV